MHFTFLRAFALLSLITGINTQLMGAAESSLNPNATPWYPSQKQPQKMDKHNQDTCDHGQDTHEYDELWQEIAKNLSVFTHQYAASASANHEPGHTCLYRAFITPIWTTNYTGPAFIIDPELAHTIEQVLREKQANNQASLLKQPNRQ